ncbi:hypothetical protein KGA66_04510 [Actinocrinis puniceicyclus]|uniref:Uncharacterized protein n=1 Tax=Actinocrinis puniceicyclus TaxID=977794 RepID=A0A8J7WHF4_9ACTN|nr:hypothetical protein [Actinocrinis puniceicyclus]MBS2962296.1 hypothetical protein [Actinocrinis puniceicyclus]
MTYGHEDEGSPGPEPPAGRGRRRKPEPEPERAAPESAAYDAQWEQSGLGWDPQAWNEAQRDQYAATQSGYALDEFAPDPYPADSYDSYRSDPNDQYRGHPHIPSQYEPARHTEAPPDADREPPVEHAPGPHGRSGYPRDEYEFTHELTDEFEEEFDDAPARARTPAAEPATEPPRTLPAAVASGPGQGAFGAAGLAVVTGVGALVATPVLAVVVGLGQVGLAVGWLRTSGYQSARRTLGSVVAIGLACVALAYRLAPDRAPTAMIGALGVGFVFLAADQLFRRNIGPGRHRSEALAAAVTAAAFTVLPAGYLVAQRQDPALAGACALAAAVAVLCAALVGAGTGPAGVAAGVIAGAALGALSAATLGAAAGTAGGALGGTLSGLFAIAGARAADRVGAEGGDVRISAQVLPVALSAIGAVIAAQVVR